MKRRWLVRIAGLLLAVAGIGVALLFVTTPPGAEIQRLTAAAAERYGVALLQPGEVPTVFADLLVATEDERFYQHHGIDVIGVGRAVLNDLQHGCLCQGGSTLTQQLVKETYLGGSDYGLNKLRGVALAFKIETAINKRQILADYLSITPLGFGLYGAPVASCAYFHRPLSALDVAQYALLAGMPQAPASYDPRNHPDVAARRRAEVLTRGVSEGYITQEQADAAEAEPLLADRPATGGC
ncbi:MAG TPA: biosynthetic peptidoglycan transglycosylase [Candidatus Dormibacteraeota bacterium]